jgi:hypothetical protein
LSATESAIDHNLAGQAAALATAIDPSVEIDGTQTWGSCTAAGCTAVVTVTNKGVAPTTVVVNGGWKGDSQPVGDCQAIVGPVDAGQSATANCTDGSSAWAAFYQRANNAGGYHPYEVDWTAAALAVQTDLSGLNSEAGPAGKPADRNSADTTGRYAVYSVNYQDNAKKTQAWKYGVTTTAGWRATANAQLANCLAASKTSCAVGLVTTSNSRAAAYGLVNALVAEAKSRSGQCPPGQWVACD